MKDEMSKMSSIIECQDKEICDLKDKLSFSQKEFDLKHKEYYESKLYFEEKLKEKEENINNKSSMNSGQILEKQNQVDKLIKEVHHISSSKIELEKRLKDNEI